MRLLSIITLLFVFSYSSLFGQSRDTTINCPNGGTFNIVNIYDVITCNFGTLEGRECNNVYIKPDKEIKLLFKDLGWQPVSTGDNYGFTRTGEDEKIININRNNKTVFNVDFQFKVKIQYWGNYYWEPYPWWDYINIECHIYDVVKIGKIDISSDGSAGATVRVKMTKFGSGEENLEYSVGIMVFSSIQIFF